MTEQVTTQPEADTDYPIVDINDVIWLDANVDGTGGTLGQYNKPVYTIDQIVANLNRTSYPGTGIPGPQWSYGEDYMGQNKSGDPLIINYAFYQTQSELFQVPYVFPNAAGTGLVGRNEYFQFAPFSAAQQAATNKAIQLWDDLIQVSFVQTTAANADITYGNLKVAPTTQAYAYLPYNYGGTSAGLQRRRLGLAVARPATSSSTRAATACRPWSTRSATRSASRIRAPTTPLRASRSPIRRTPNIIRTTAPIRSCPISTPSSIGARHSTSTCRPTAYSGDPLIHDIAAAQRIYGADMTTRTGDTVYGFNSNAGRDAFDFVKTPAADRPIWDAGGIDTIDTSGFATTQHDRPSGRSLSSIGGVTYDTAPTLAQVNANRAAAGSPRSADHLQRQHGGSARQPDRRPPDRQFRHRLRRHHRECDRRQRRRHRSSATRRQRPHRQCRQ